MCQKRRRNWHGDSTEIALVEYALTKTGIKGTRKKFPRIAEFPFDSSRKCMTTIHQTEKEYWLLPKGLSKYY
jgi:Ca2+-transporting ATPase